MPAASESVTPISRACFGTRCQAACLTALEISSVSTLRASSSTPVGSIHSAPSTAISQRPYSAACSVAGSCTARRSAEPGASTAPWARAWAARTSAGADPAGASP